MISATSENEQATVITLTETELEGIHGGWGHGCDWESDSCDDDHFEISHCVHIEITYCDRFEYNRCDHRW